MHTGHKYGAHFVLYEGSPDECHSRYCVHVTGGGGGGDSWGHMKTVTRLMPVQAARNRRPYMDLLIDLITGLPSKAAGGAFRSKPSLTELFSKA